MQLFFSKNITAIDFVSTIRLKKFSANDFEANDALNNRALVSKKLS